MNTIAEQNIRAIRTIERRNAALERRPERWREMLTREEVSFLELEDEKLWQQMQRMARQ
jgi:hypothetical protein